MDWLDQQQALDLLRVSDDNWTLIDELASSIPAYIETLTGYPAALTAGSNPNPVVKSLARFILQLWFNPDGTDGERVEQVVNSLAKSVKASVTAMLGEHLQAAQAEGANE